MFFYMALPSKEEFSTEHLTLDRTGWRVILPIKCFCCFICVYVCVFLNPGPWSLFYIDRTQWLCWYMSELLFTGIILQGLEIWE